ncbi:hypothetical protein [Streptomyces sp. NRRL S-813]|uniref:hypothetical protein n=1 Tax=Streptomyces sp. NRRL S-813 TaxID=1463919 RepID=UPI001F4341D8|nr:hypothetical protein [Streptomyces sp. NRRL S-813]
MNTDDQYVRSPTASNSAARNSEIGPAGQVQEEPGGLYQLPGDHHGPRSDAVGDPADEQR